MRLILCEVKFHFLHRLFNKALPRTNGVGRFLCTFQRVNGHFYVLCACIYYDSQVDDNNVRRINYSSTRRLRNRLKEARDNFYGLKKSTSLQFNLNSQTTMNDVADGKKILHNLNLAINNRNRNS